MFLFPPDVLMEVLVGSSCNWRAVCTPGLHHSVYHSVVPHEEISHAYPHINTTRNIHEMSFCNRPTLYFTVINIEQTLTQSNYIRIKASSSLYINLARSSSRVISCCWTKYVIHFHIVSNQCNPLWFQNSFVRQNANSKP